MNPPRLEGVEHTEVALGDFTAHVALAGEGRPVVLLHGWPQHWWEWRHLIGPLAADGRRVICPDLRGLGWSEAPGHGYSTDQYAIDLIALLDALGLERVDLVSHDWGAFTAFKACLQAPERFHRLVAMGAPSPHMRFSPRIVAHLWRYWYQLVLAAPGLGPRAVRGLGDRRNIVGRWAGLGRLADEEVRVFTAQFTDPARVHASVALYRDALRTAFVAPLLPRYRRARLRVPTLVVHGAQDGPTHPDLMRAIEGKTDDLRVEVLPGVSHFLADEAPDRVLALVREHLGP